MLALVVTVLFALYALGPDLVARWALEFVVPRKSLAQSKSEEITRGILWAAGPLLLAWWLRHVGFVRMPPISFDDLKTFFSGLYSESFFDAHRPQFFAAALFFAKVNLCLLIRLYGIVVFFSVAFDILISYFGRLRRMLSSHHRLKAGLATAVLPRISEWHVILSPILLPRKDLKIRVDVMTKGNVLYDGALREKMISADGSLHSITLEEPRRFKREQYLEERRERPGAKAEDYWKKIPGEAFVIMASEIATLNVRHVPESVQAFKEEYAEIKIALNELAVKVEQVRQRAK